MTAPSNTWLTEGIPGTGGRIKERPEDFLVDEVPLYQPTGQGEHIYMLIEKRGLSTLHVVRLLAKHFGVRTFDVGYAGLKDKRAITRQVFSVYTPGKKPEDFPSLQYDRVGVLWTDLHANKLRRGHLAGNRFSIKVRGVSPTSAVTALKVLRRLAESGAPNRVGEQRFGYLGRNHLVGRGLILGDDQTVLDALLAPAPDVADNQAPARDLYARGQFGPALDAFNRDSRAERRVLSVLARGKSAGQAIRALDHQERDFFLSAFQSAVFNVLLDQRLADGSLARLDEGDVAFKHDNRALFAVTNEALADPALVGRLSRFEVSPSGPMWGPSMLRAAGAIDEREVGALASVGVTPELLAAYEARWRGAIDGARRPYRVPITDVDVEGGVDEFGGYVRCVFDLPRGAFATTVMAEVMKTGTGGDESGDDD